MDIIDRGVKCIFELTVKPRVQYRQIKLSPPLFENQSLKHEKYEEIKRQIGSEVKIATAKWLKSKLATAKYSIFGGEYRQSGNPGYRPGSDLKLNP